MTPDLELTLVEDDDPRWLVALHGWSEDDARWDARRDQRWLDLAALQGVAHALATGRPQRDRVWAHGRWYPRRWSFEPPFAPDLAVEGECLLWFYPMRESRHVFRADARALAEALLQVLPALKARAPAPALATTEADLRTAIARLAGHTGVTLES